MSRNTFAKSIKLSLALGFLMLAPCQREAWAEERPLATKNPAPPPRTPLGIYTVLHVEAAVRALPPGDVDTNLQAFFTQLLDNQAVGGLALQVYWATLNGSGPGVYSWNYLEDAFASVSAWNLAHSGQPAKTVQLLLLPGFNSPQWELNNLESCDAFFDGSAPLPKSTCGRVTNVNFNEPHLGDQLPLPWNPTYQADWNTFLTAVGAKYGSNPSLVSISVAGPTAASDEILLPRGTTLDQFDNTVSNNTIWATLLKNAGKSSTDDSAFIAEWKAAINMYAKIFPGLTLVVTPGDGLPNLGGSYTTPPLFTLNCMNPSDMDCAAEAEILSYFMESTVAEFNAKATQTSGLKASNKGLNLGIDAVKTISLHTKTAASTSGLVLGGAQFDTSFSNQQVPEGCTSKFPPDGVTLAEATVADIPTACFSPDYNAGKLPKLSPTTLFSAVPAEDLISPEQAAYNVLQDFFNDTPAALAFGGTLGSAPLNYLQIYSDDIVYSSNTSSPAMVTETGGVVVSIEAQDLLYMAKTQLLSIAVGEPYCHNGACPH